MVTKCIQIGVGNVNHQPPEYNVWKFLSGLVNLEDISIDLNITEIPSYAFIPLNGAQHKLQTIRFYTPNEITIQNKAFYHLDHLKVITFYSQIQRIQNQAFAFKQKSNKSNDSFKIIFQHIHLDQTVFEPGSFDGIKRPTNVISLIPI